MGQAIRGSFHNSRSLPICADYVSGIVEQLMCRTWSGSLTTVGKSVAICGKGQYSLATPLNFHLMRKSLDRSAQRFVPLLHASGLILSADFKHGPVVQTKQPGVSCAQVARELGIRESLRAFMALEVSPNRD